jgi:hypothetical protein
MAGRQTTINVQASPVGFASGSHGIALVALPTVKNRVVHQAAQQQGKIAPARGGTLTCRKRCDQSSKNLADLPDVVLRVC